jgi:hypothetical protein
MKSSLGNNVSTKFGADRRNFKIVHGYGIMISPGVTTLTGRDHELDNPVA